MNANRRTFGYPPVIKSDPELYRIMDSTNKNVGRIGFCIGLLAVGGYYLHRKVKELSRECEKLKETGK